MAILNSTNIIHIIVGAGLVHGLDLTHELRLLTAALLYGDKVKLCSIASSTLITLLPLCCLRDDELLEFIPDWGEALGLSQDELATTAEHYKHLRHKKRRNKQELLAYTQVKYGLEQYKIDLKAKVEEIAINAGAEGLLSALETGLIEVQILRLGADNTAIVNEFFNSIKDAILSGHTYPLFDDSAGQLVNAAIKEGKLVPLNTSASRAKQVGLSSNLLNRLPLFDNASVDEIVDIRKELDKPLVHFRSAIIKFSKEIESSSWEREFPQEVEQVFHEHVAPAVLEIEEACKSNKLLNSLVHNFGSKSLVIPGTSALGFLISKAIDLPDIVTQSVALAAGTSTVGWEAVREWREKNQEIERNQLYFYYRVGKQLSQ